MDARRTAGTSTRLSCAFNGGGATDVSGPPQPCDAADRACVERHSRRHEAAMQTGCMRHSATTSARFHHFRGVVLSSRARNDSTRMKFVAQCCETVSARLLIRGICGRIPRRQPRRADDRRASNSPCRMVMSLKKDLTRTERRCAISQLLCKSQSKQCNEENGRTSWQQSSKKSHYRAIAPDRAMLVEDMNAQTRCSH